MKRLRSVSSRRLARTFTVVLLSLVIAAVLTPMRASAAPTGSWAGVASIPTARVSFGAATGPDGRVYAIGGIVPGSKPQGAPSNAVEAYDPTAGTWATLPTMPTARGDLAVATGPDGRIYAIGGYLPPPQNYDVNTVEAYDPIAGSWSTVAPMPTPRDGLAAVTGSDGRIYAIGGESNGSFVKTVEAYDTTANTWSTVASLPVATWRLAAAAAPDGKIYAMGGDMVVGTTPTFLNTAEAYSPTTNNWTSIAPMSSARFGLAAATGPDGHIYAIGGVAVVGANSALSSAEAYDPTSQAWSAVSSMGTARVAHAAATDQHGNIYAISGDGSAGLLSTVEALPITGAPPAGVTITPNTTGSDGTPHVDWHNALTLSITGCAGATASYHITQGGASIAGGSMSENPAGTYTAAIPAFIGTASAAKGQAWVTISLACPSGPPQATGFALYIDPSGTVKDASTGQPIASATVTLYSASSASGPFSIVPNGSGALSPATNQNPETSDSNGHYLWNVVPGYYKVRAAKAGCASPTDPTQPYVESAVLTIPPAATGVDLLLGCNQPDTDLGLANLPANITTSATSAQGAAVTYAPPTATDESGDSPAASVACTPVSGSTFAIGSSTVTCTATDGDDTPSSVSQSFSVTVNPALTASGQTVSATEGQAFSGVVATGADYGAGTLSATINWGDGASSVGSVTLNGSGSYSVSGSHTYSEEGASLPLAVAVSASGGLSATATVGAAVADAALSTSAPVVVISHKTVGVASLFTDADPSGVVGDYTATVSWGDGSKSVAYIIKNPYRVGFIDAAAHVYALRGTYSITLTISDAGGASIVTTRTIKL